MSQSGRSRSRSRNRSRSYSRSRSRSDSRSRSPSEKSYSDYSFYSQASKKNAKSTKNKLPPKGPNKATGKGNNKPNKTVHRKSVGTPRSDQGGVSRVMSANRLRILELRNRVAELTDQLSASQLENRDLKRMIHKQERKLGTYELQENGMPQVMERQANETNMLREQLRRLKEKHEERGEKLKKKSEELETMRKLTRKMQGLIDDKNLMERDQLKKKLDRIQHQLDIEIGRTKDSDQHIKNLEKNHKQHMHSEKAKRLDVEAQLHKLQEKCDKLETDLKEKEKEQTLMNIYSYRAQRPPHRLDNSLKSSSQTDLSKPKVDPSRTEGKRGRKGGSTDNSARREEQRPVKLNLRDDHSPAKSDRRLEEPYIESRAAISPSFSLGTTSKNHINKERRDNGFDHGDVGKSDSTKSGHIYDDPLSWLREEREREERAREEEKEKLLRDRMRNEEIRRKEEAKLNEQRRREEEFRRKEEEQKKREEQSRMEEQMKREQMRREQMKREEEQRMKEEEQRRYSELHRRYEYEDSSEEFQNKKNDYDRYPVKDQKVDEHERLKKDDLLAKLRAIDDGKNNSEVTASPKRKSESPTRKSESPSRRSEERKLIGSPTNRKEYHFTEPVNNLHQGLPSHGKPKSAIFEDENFTFGSYRPSFVLDDAKTKHKDDTLNNKLERGDRTDLSTDFPKQKFSGNVSTDASLDAGGSYNGIMTKPVGLNREKQNRGPVFRSTANNALTISDDEVEEIQELVI